MYGLGYSLDVKKCEDLQERQSRWMNGIFTKIIFPNVNKTNELAHYKGAT